MRRFLLRRLAFALLSVIGATAFVFTLSRMAGDPVLLYAKPAGYGVDDQYLDNLRKKLGTDKPLVIQYGMWMSRMVRGDLGRTLFGERRVTQVIREKLFNTFQLAFAGWLLATIVGIPLGVLSAVKRGTVWDYIGRAFALFGQAIPAFTIGIVGILIFSVYLGWLPSAFKGDGISIKHFILPAITIGWGAAAGYTRLTRSAMLEILDSEFIKLARAKGLSSEMVIWKHALRNALIAPLTFSFLLLAGLLNGAVVAEVIFAWPGLGRVALVEAVGNNDFPLLTGAVLVFIVIYLVVSLFADLLYAWIDPRIRFT